MRTLLGARRRDRGLTTAPLPPLVPALLGWAGVPSTADGLAYDGATGLLAVATPDGRVVAAGPCGGEASLGAPPGPPSPTLALTFLEGRGQVLRLAASGELHLWNLPDAAGGGPPPGPAAALATAPDAATSLAVLGPEPFALLGFASGCLGVVVLTAEPAAGDTGGDGDGAGPASPPASHTPTAPAQPLSPAPPATPVAGLALTDHVITTQAMGEATGAVLAVAAVRARGGGWWALAAHAASGATAWDVNRGAPLACAQAPPEAGGTTAAAWVGGGGLLFATGHARGGVVVWALPPECGGGGGAHPSPAAPCPPAAKALRTLRPPGGGGSPVRLLLPVPPGAGGADGGGGAGGLAPPATALLVWGGGPPDQAGELALWNSPVEPPPPGGGAGGDVTTKPAPPRPLPWFGAVRGVALAPDPGGGPPAILTLAEGGQVVAHDGATLAPAPLALPLQAMPALTAAALATAPPDAARAAPGPAALHSASRPACLAACTARGSAAAAAGWRAPLPAWRAAAAAEAGGRPPLPAPPAPTPRPSLLFTGHADGRVRVWDAASVAPALLDTTPWGAAAGGGRPRAVTAVQALPAAGLLAAGHDRGALAVHQFCAAPRRVRPASLELHGEGGVGPVDPPPDAGDDPVAPPGWQLILRAEPGAGGASVRAVALCGAPRPAAAAGDDDGWVAVVDLGAPALAWRRKVCGVGVAALAFCAAPARGAAPPPGAGRRRPSDDGPPTPAAPPCLALLVAAADGAVAALDAATGEALGGWARVPGGGAALCLAPLGSVGEVAAFGTAPPDLAWAGTAAGPAVVGPPETAASPSDDGRAPSDGDAFSDAASAGAGSDGDGSVHGPPSGGPGPAGVPRRASASGLGPSAVPRAASAVGLEPAATAPPPEPAPPAPALRPGPLQAAALCGPASPTVVASRVPARDWGHDAAHLLAPSTPTGQAAGAVRVVPAAARRTSVEGGADGGGEAAGAAGVSAEAMAVVVAAPDAEPAGAAPLQAEAEPAAAPEPAAPAYGVADRPAEPSAAPAVVAPGGDSSAPPAPAPATASTRPAPLVDVESDESDSELLAAALKAQKAGRRGLGRLGRATSPPTSAGGTPLAGTTASPSLLTPGGEAGVEGGEGLVDGGGAAPPAGPAAGPGPPPLSDATSASLPAPDASGPALPPAPAASAPPQPSTATPAAVVAPAAPAADQPPPTTPAPPTLAAFLPHNTPIPSTLLLATPGGVRVLPLGALLPPTAADTRPPAPTDARHASPATLAWPFVTRHGPGVACLGADGRLRALALPGLSPLADAALAGGLLGADWPPPGGVRGGPPAGAGCEDGGVLLFGPAGEVGRATLGGAARCAPGAPLLPPAPPPPAPSGSAPDPVHAFSPLAAAAGLLTHARDAAGAAAAGVERVGRGLVAAAAGGGGGGGCPPLDRVLLAEVPSPEESRKAAAAAATAADRAALLAGARAAGAGGRPVPRTADEIRAAYGRPTAGPARAAESAAASRGDARAARAARGERLASRRDATAAMADGAAGFEAAARALREAQARKWWQL